MAKENLTIRKAQAKDRDVIEVLWYKVIVEAFKVEQFDERLTPKRELKFKMNQLDEAFKNQSSTYFLAFEANTLVGTIAYGSPPNRGILKQTGNELKDTVELGSLYIDPSKQKRGYGRKLLIYALKDLLDQGVKTVCFDSIYETSKAIWRRMFGEPKYNKKAPNHNFYHMIWVVDVKSSIDRLINYKP